MNLQRVAGRAGRHDMREAAKVGSRNAHPKCGCGLIEREQGVAGRDERHEFERVRPEHPAARGGANRVAQLTPLVEKQRAHRIRLGGGRRIVQRLHQAIATVEQDLQQLVAELLVADRISQLLDRKNQERVPLIERSPEML